MSSGYEYTYQTIVHKLIGCDFDEATARLGLDPPVNGIVKVVFMGREYEISSTGIVASDGLSSEPNDRSILIYYITSKGSGEPEYSYRLLHYFIPQGAFGRGDISWLTTPLVREFGNDYTRFCEALRMLGAIFQESSHEGEHIWTYRILPKMPMQIIYFEADDELPCEIKLKLDSSASRFMEFEQLAFLCGGLVRTMVRINKSGLLYVE